MIRTTLLLALLAALVQGGEQSAPHLAKVTPPAAKIAVDAAIRTGVDFLVKNQNKDGSFGKRTVGRTYELWCHVPGGHMAFQGASTALCWLGMNDAPYQPEKSIEAQKKTLAWLVKYARVKRPFPAQFYNVWSFSYGLRALGQALRKKSPGAAPEAIKKTMREIVKALDIYQSPDGGWGYLDFKMPGYKPTWSTSFTTATALIGLYEAQKAGIEVPERVLQRGIRLMKKYRTPDGNYGYSISWRWRPQGAINRPQGSSMRNQACNLALALFAPQEYGEKKLRRGLRQLVDNHRFAIAGLRRPRPHESWYAVSGYFYLYGQQYAAMVLDHMPQGDKNEFWPPLVRFVLKTRQPDGSYWDYPTYGYHKFYGTGYALIALSRCPQDIAKTLTPKS
ncbi:MAG: terpene cyclase/mutase family protein [Planctomycetota bacterium]|nr:terpene cyclase/mutase family protein [Planctomycetota bacterium]